MLRSWFDKSDGVNRIVLYVVFKERYVVNRNKDVEYSKCLIADKKRLKIKINL